MVILYKFFKKEKTEYGLYQCSILGRLQKFQLTSDEAV